jgi:hypothetical protein
MRVIELEELSDVLSVFIKRVEKFYGLDIEKWLVMQQTGCRINESLETERWSTGFDSFKLQPQKLNNIRNIAYSDMSERTIDYILKGNKNLSKNNYNRYVHQFHKEMNFKKFYIGNKGCSTHLFRHRIVKEKKQILGWSDLQIRKWLGEKTQKAANSYIYSQIMVNF